MRVAIATAADVRERDEDWVPLRDALVRAGADPVLVAWDDGVDWAGADRVVVRSTWDYHLGRRDEFLAWSEEVAAVTRFANAPAVLRWNTDKRYLAELLAAGLPVVPTAFAAPGQDVDLPPADEVVVKPAVSAGSRDTARYRGDEAGARAHVGRLQAVGRTAMVQPYLPAVDDHGETALVYVAGQYSHAVRKGPLLQPGGRASQALWAEEDIRPRHPSPAEREVAEAVLDAVPFARAELLYARVDLLPGLDGAPTVLELELTEPSLFLSEGPGAPDRLATAILA